MKPLYLAICVFIGIFIVLLMSTHPLPATPAGWGDFFGSATYPAVLIGLGALALEKKKVKTDDLFAVPPKKEGGHLK